ncbi:DUF5686 and carboxypeptidase-like regulatory domain-containing protein [Bacteroides sp. 224]|uniref:DUF5686 and carboxypeptidase-like regulatory domain-containing protein n=1 Tax=Bacteroides sp. 224 TaxID=2302936 RepID=UPI0013D30C79|nr:DUF5686 and carboxypeptidase-like regulatory domain-containing protein [Bacteroides sp. 224]NDV66723.1 carboxypeptidase-like regulatory domain-containing protein [Bacteroides sp. 224]
MDRLYKRLIIVLLLIFTVPQVFAQIRGLITDSLTNEPLMYISVYYEGKGVGTTSSEKGEYSVEVRSGWNELTFSAIGYNTKVVKIKPGTRRLDVKLSSSDVLLSEVVVKPGRERYSRKNNPAVDFMRKVIENKSTFKLEENDFYQNDKYQKIKMSLNDMTPEKAKEGIYKKIPFLEKQLEPSPNSDKFILPISVQETASQTIYRKDPKSEKTIIRGMTSNGIEDFLSTGDMVGTVLKDIFSDINIYDNDIRLLQERFVSPISNSAISFYKFYLMDTIMVDKHQCVHLSFVPQNSQDFGFTGHLYVVNDSSYAVKKCTMNLPKKTGVNFVENMDIVQEFTQLPDGNWVLTDDDMIVDLYAIKALQGLQVQRTTKYSNYSFNSIESPLFRAKGSVIKETDMLIKSDEFWADVRQVPLTKTESNMDLFVNQLAQIPGFKYVIFVAKAFIENHVETGGPNNPSKFDLGPINTIITSNYVDGLRLRASGRTTGKLHPQWFLSGYGAYGFKDKKFKYEGTVTHAFKKKEFFPWEFPKHNISASYKYDVMSPMDKFLTTDKDNVFVSWKITTVDQMSYVKDATLKYELETMNGLGFTVTAKHRNDEPTGNLHYFKNDANATLIKDMTTAEVGITMEYAPGRTYVNTKQRRIAVSRDMPVYTLSHTTGFKGVLGGDYDFNFTEASIWKRFWLSSWGNMDMTVKAGAQWNKVPFPLLILPAANLSYITQQETFTLINNMEFFNDRYASLALTYEMNGKLFNRIPLIKKLKWREAFRFRMLWGDLTDKNNPYLNPDDTDLFRFPTRNGEYTSFTMDPKVPYMELSVGVYNIFKLLHVEYVRRLNYLDNPNVKKHGIRFMILMRF